MNGIKIKDVCKEDEIPKGNKGRRLNWTPLLKSLATLEKGEVTVLEVDKMSRVSIIRKTVDKKANGKFRVQQRKIDDTNRVYITKL